MIERKHFFMTVVAAVCVLLTTTGCPGPSQPTGDQKAGQKTAAPATRPTVTLEVLVVDDPALAAGVRLLRGEWTERTGGRLQVTEWSMAELNDAMAQAEPSLPADVVIYPDRALGALAAGGALRPMRSSVLDEPEMSPADWLPLVRERIVEFGDQTMAIPLGSPPLMLCCDSHSLADLDEPVPSTWEDYRRLAAKLHEQDKPCVLPLAGNAAAVTFLARTSSYSDRGSRDGLLFDPVTFAPRITEPAFVRALVEMTEELAAHPQSLDLSLACGFAEAVEAVSRGRAAVAFGWPGAARGGEDASENNAEGTTEQSRLGFAELPRAVRIYNSTRGEWITNRDEAPVTVLGIAGRLASVTASGRNAASAFKLLGWLGSGKTATQLSSRSPATLWFRRSQQGDAARWLGDGGRADIRETAEAASQALSRRICFQIPRIPGIDDYLQTLSEAVRQAVAGESPEVVLHRTTQAWEKITERLGPERQQFAYRGHLGL